MQREHIVICGARQTGKSTLVRRLLAACTLPVYGFFTVTGPRDAQGYHSIYLYPAGNPARVETEANHVGDCNSRERTVNSAVFETLGVRYLDALPGGVIAMDELGFMETNSPSFCRKVLSCLDGDIPVLAVTKNRYDVDFLNAIREHPKVRVHIITEENRDALYEELLPVIERWNREESHA